MKIDVTPQEYCVLMHRRYEDSVCPKYKEVSKEDFENLIMTLELEEMSMRDVMCLPKIKRPPVSFGGLCFSNNEKKAVYAYCHRFPCCDVEYFVLES